MKMKRGIFFFAVLLLAIVPMVLQFVSGQEPSAPYGLSPEEIDERLQQLQQMQNVTQWQLIGERFKLSLLRNPIIDGIDAAFTKISWLFSFLFGMPYSLSVTLLMAIALWVWIFLIASGFLYKSFRLSSSASYGITFVVCILLSLFHVWENSINAMGTVIFAQEAWWLRIVLIFMFIGFLYLLMYLSKLAGQELEKRKKAAEEERTSHAGKIVQAQAEGIQKGKEIVGK